MSYGQFGLSPVQISFGGMTWASAMSAGVSSISAIDASFNGEEFLTFAQGAFLRVMEARSNDRLNDVHPLLSQAMYETFRSTKAKIPKISTVEHATIYDAHRDASWDSVTVRMAAKTTAKKNNDFVEDWTFQRPAVTGQQQIPPECPSCGAPTSLDEEGKCKYCRVAVTGARGGWKLVRAVPPPTAPKVSSGAKGWLAFWIIFMVLMTVVLPIGIVIAVMHSTSQVTGGFGLNSSSNNGPVVVGLSSSTTIAGVLPTPKVPTTLKKTGTVSASTIFTGGFNGTLEGNLLLSGATSGSCDSRAPKVNGLSFSTTGTGDDGEKVTSSVTLNLPPGARGPGDFSLPVTKLDVTASFAGHYADGSNPDSAQTWVLAPTTTATFSIDATGSGSLSVSGLAPTAPFPPGNSLSKPLQFNLTFTCK